MSVLPRDFVPAVAPSVHVVCARPLTSVVAAVGETLPPPLVTVNVTARFGRT